MKHKQLLAFCRSLPQVTEDVKWGADLVFSIGGKMFAAFDVKGGPGYSFKATPENFAMLTKQDGIIPAPYAARFHWVSVVVPTALPVAAAKELIAESYRLVAAKLPAKVRQKLGHDTALETRPKE